MQLPNGLRYPRGGLERLPKIATVPPRRVDVVLARFSAKEINNIHHGKNEQRNCINRNNFAWVIIGWHS